MISLEPPSEMLDSETMQTYLDRLGSLECTDFMPPAILGAARFVISPNPPVLSNQADVLGTLPLVSRCFWRAASDAIDEADWPTRHPNDVQCGTKEFPAQWDLASQLFSNLQQAGAEGSKNTDTKRRQAADKIIAASKKLRRQLDTTTGYDDHDDWLGLYTVHARDIVNAAGTKQLGEPFSVIPSGSPENSNYYSNWDVLHSLNLQKLLIEAESLIQQQAIEYETDWMTHPRQSRFILKLQQWFSQAHLIAGNDTHLSHYTPCVRTANEILRKRHPEVVLKSNPAKPKRVQH